MANDAFEAENNADISKVGSESVSFSKLWEEVKDWRTNWTWVGFFKALLLGLAASFFDSATDFNFPWSVPVDCANTTLASKAFKVAYIFSTCGLMFYKNVQRLTFTFIAYPGFLFALGDRGITGLVKRCWGTKAQGLVGKLGHVLAVILELPTCIALLGAAMWSDRWEKKLPTVAPVYVAGDGVFFSSHYFGDKMPRCLLPRTRNKALHPQRHHHRDEIRSSFAADPPFWTEPNHRYVSKNRLDGLDGPLSLFF